MKHRSAKNSWVWIAIVLLVAGAGTWWYLASRNGGSAAGDASGESSSSTEHQAKQSAVQLTMEVVSMSITGIENNSVQLANEIIVKNPLPVPLSASRIDYEVRAHGAKLAEGSYNQPLRVPAAGNTTVTFPVRVSIEALKSLAEASRTSGSDSADYLFVNTIHADVPIAGERVIPFNVKKRLPVVRPLKVQPGKPDIDKLGLKNSGIDMTLHVTNPNTFEIRMVDGHYSMSIDGETTMKGATEKTVVLPPKQTTPVQMHLELKTGKALKTGWKMLFDRKETRYTLTFDSKLSSDEPLLQNSTMHFTDKGNLQDLKEAID